MGLLQPHGRHRRGDGEAAVSNFVMPGFVPGIFLSFRDGPKDQTRNLEILRGAMAPRSSMLRIAPE
jgi:hypothetical protein